MKPHSRRSTVFVVVLLAGVLPWLIGLAAIFVLGDVRHVQEPLHQGLELAGACIALGVAMLLLIHARHESEASYLLWVVAALLAMGLMDAAHGIAHFGVEWSWLRHGSTLVGGVLFGCVWLPPPAIAVHRKQAFILVAGGLAIATALAVWLLSSRLPAPILPEGYSLAVKIANGLGGLGFLAAALFFLRRYLRRPHAEDLTFGSLALIFTASGLLFGFSSVWAAGWWFWHGFRLLAYCVVLAVAFEIVVSLYQEIARHAQDLESRVRERTAEIERRNEQLAAEIAERSRAEAELQRARDELEMRVEERTVELNRTLDSLSAERQRFNDVLNQLPAYVVLISLDYRVPFANRFFEERFGKSSGKRCHEYLFGRVEPCETCESFRVVETGAPHHWEWIGPDGRNYDIHDFPFKDADGTPLILEMGVDITERRQAENELRAAHEQLAARADQLRALAGDLTLTEQRERRRLARILHDHLQQLLVGAKFRAAILGRNAEALVKQAADEIANLLDEAIKASRSLTAELSPPILLEGGLGPGLEWLARWMSAKHGLTVELAIEPGIAQPSEDVKVLLFESVRELLFNAVKHARVHTAFVNLRMIGGLGLQITVSDAGPGFDRGMLKQAGEGGGFGLFSIRERLGLMGGKMEIHSTPGEGSRFVLAVPLQTPGKPGSPEVSSSDKTEAGSIPAPISETGSRVRIRVLVADDHPVMRDGLTRLLGAETDLEVIGQASDGQVAVDLARKLRPHIVLMDLSMPKLSGIDATRIIREELPEVKVIGLSMFDEPERAQALLAAGAAAYLTKSAPWEQIMAAVRRCVGSRHP